MNHVFTQPAHDRAALLSTTRPTTDADTGDQFVLSTDLPRELRLLTGQPCPFTARQIVTLASNDQLPLERLTGARRWWGIRRRRLPEVAAALGMAPAAEAAKRAGHAGQPSAAA